MDNENISRRELLSIYNKFTSSTGKYMSIKTIEDIYYIHFKWKANTKWAENNSFLSVWDSEDNLILSEKLTEIQLYVSRNMDGTKNIYELCLEAELHFSIELSVIHKDVMNYIVFALKKKIIEAQ